jgi:hypothetical protein
MTHGREQPRVGRVRALVLQYPTTTFFLLTFLITWAVWVPNVLAPDSFAGILALFGTYGPAAAAVIVAAIVGLVAPFPLLDGRQGCLRELFVIMLVELPAMSVLYTWVFQHTAGSALLAILFHASWNLFSVGAAHADTVRSALVILLLTWVLAGAVAVYWLRQGHTASIGTALRQVRYDA